mmetsp:Transcript_79676/g.138284  ORF Transcript_79676/g.138284 Transcript_79676/m.138284 type:complete len:82 (-) Transcript_79676:162-407(-)
MIFLHAKAMKQRVMGDEDVGQRAATCTVCQSCWSQWLLCTYIHLSKWWWTVSLDMQWLHFRHSGAVNMGISVKQESHQKQA